jgi:hypothetical protein
VLSSTAAGQLAWSGADIPAREKLVAVTCTAGSPCLTISGGNGTTLGVTRVFQSTDGGATWAGGAALPKTTALGVNTQLGSDVACDPAGACVIVGATGGIWRSTDGGSRWDPVNTGKLKDGFTRAACPDTGVCVIAGTGTGGVVLHGTQPTAVAGPFKDGAVAIACDSPTRCTAAGTLSGVASISAPWSRFGTLKPLPGKAKTAPTAIGALSCPSANACVGLVSAPPPPGRAVATTSLSDNSWRRISTGSDALAGIGCVSSWCSAVGGGGSWSDSANVGVNWKPVNSVPALNVLDCATGSAAGTCLGGGSSAIGKTTTAGEFWTTPFPGITTFDAAMATCASYPQCVIVGKSKVLATPDGGTTFNFRFPAGDVTAGPAAGSCVAAIPGRCYGAGSGTIFTTFDGAVSQWQAGPIPTAPAEALSGMACPTSTLCLVAGAESIYRGTLDVVDNRARWSWVSTDANAIEAFKGISCSSTSSCTAVGAGELGYAQIATTTDPELLHWESQQLANTIKPDDATALMGVSCPADGVCVADGLRGFVFSTTDNWVTYSLERFDAPVADSEAAPNLTGVSCMSPTRCLLLGSKTSPPATPNGAVYVGARTG